MFGIYIVWYIYCSFIYYLDLHFIYLMYKIQDAIII